MENPILDYQISTPIKYSVTISYPGGGVTEPLDKTYTGAIYKAPTPVVTNDYTGETVEPKDYGILGYNYSSKFDKESNDGAPVHAGKYCFTVNTVVALGRETMYTGQTKDVEFEIFPAPIKAVDDTQNPLEISKTYDGDDDVTSAKVSVKGGLMADPDTLYDRDEVTFSPEIGSSTFAGKDVQDVMIPIKYYISGGDNASDYKVEENNTVNVRHIINAKELSISGGVGVNRPYNPYDYYVKMDTVTFSGQVDTLTKGVDYLLSNGKLANNDQGSHSDVSFKVTLLNGNYKFSTGIIGTCNKGTVDITQPTLNAMFMHGGVFKNAAVSEGGVLGIQSVIAKAINANASAQNAIATADNEAATSGFEVAVPSVDNISKATATIPQSFDYSNIDNAQDANNYNYLLISFVGLIALLSVAGAVVFVRRRGMKK